MFARLAGAGRLGICLLSGVVEVLRGVLGEVTELDREEVWGFDSRAGG